MGNIDKNINFDSLLEVMTTLRNKCPWDKEQTIFTLKNLSIEEVYELAEAISEENWENIKEEIGDVLLHLVFYAHIANEQNKFNIYDVIESLISKLKEDILIYMEIQK